MLALETEWSDRGTINGAGRSDVLIAVKNYPVLKSKASGVS